MSESSLVHVVATVELKSGKRDEFLKAFHTVVPHVLQEEGCSEYAPTVDLVTEIDAQPDPRENIVVIIEKWESLDALERHLIAPHMIDYRKRVKELIVGTHLQVLESA